MSGTESPGDARLCYVSGSWAYFTTKPLAEQWGDDWNDAPYEHNAGEPYAFRDHNAERGEKPWEIIRLAWWGGGDLETPSDLHPPNSPYSVQQINAGLTPWLTDPGYGTSPRVYRPVVWAGYTVEQFIRAIESRGGTVYVPRGSAL